MTVPVYQQEKQLQKQSSLAAVRIQLPVLDAECHFSKIVIASHNLVQTFFYCTQNVIFTGELGAQLPFSKIVILP